VPPSRSRPVGGHSVRLQGVARMSEAYHKRGVTPCPVCRGAWCHWSAFVAMALVTAVNFGAVCMAFTTYKYGHALCPLNGGMQSLECAERCGYPPTHRVRFAARSWGGRPSSPSEYISHHYAQREPAHRS
jgi:hypothetical protein